MLCCLFLNVSLAFPFFVLFFIVYFSCVPRRSEKITTATTVGTVQIVLKYLALQSIMENYRVNFLKKSRFFFRKFNFLLSSSIFFFLVFISCALVSCMHNIYFINLSHTHTHIYIYTHMKIEITKEEEIKHQHNGI